MKAMEEKEIGMDAVEMGQRFITSMDTALNNWVPKEKYTLEVVQ